MILTFKQVEFLEECFVKEMNEKKRNKRFYDLWLVRMFQMIENQKVFIKSFTKTCQEQNQFPEWFNDLYDIQYELESLYDFINDKKSKRNWSHSDYQTYSLMQNNID